MRMRVILLTAFIAFVVLMNRPIASQTTEFDADLAAVQLADMIKDQQVSVALDMLYANGMMSKSDYIKQMEFRMEQRFQMQSQLVIGADKKHQAVLQAIHDFKRELWESARSGMRQRDIPW